MKEVALGVTGTDQKNLRNLFIKPTFGTMPYKWRAISSVGSEHLPYKQGVTGSNPVLPTIW